ncbi:GTP-binding protein [Teredinibacter turnerae]|uniref:GTP-binding protein n=1 Tax=Teredinibacter turnerae TaxID=2426 RepID=UPI000419F4BA|nr:ATP/GTP-binding protein [Teredinibacter turnerae]
MSELKFVITGTAGVGKSTAINAISDIPPINTDAETTDELQALKQTTTVAFDFGEVVLDADTQIRLYGTPGQERFRHMWEIIADGALGLIILVDNTRADPVADMNMYIDNFAELIDATAFVVGVTRWDQNGKASLDQYFTALEQRGLFAPVIETDPRSRDDVVLLLDSLMSVLEFA